ncbi:hypothetical protein FRB99_002319, partial [Tulasnella sp. 403]
MNIASLPNEIIVLVLSYLNWKDLLTCMRLSRSFKQFIAESIELQYLIELGSACMVDNPYTLLPVITKLQRLRRLRTAWDDPSDALADRFEVEGKIPTYDLQKGILTIGASEVPVTTSLTYYCLRSRVSDREPKAWRLGDLGVEVRDFTTDPDMDLIVLMERKRVSDKALETEEIDQLHFRTMMGNDIHPLAARPTLQTSRISMSLGDELFRTLILRGRLLAYQRSGTLGDVSYTFLQIWDWTTGKLVFSLEEQGYESSFVFLDDDSFLLAVTETDSRGTKDWYLQVYWIAYPTRQVIFAFPTIRRVSRTFIDSVLCRSDPNGPRTPTSKSRLATKMSLNDSPFRASPSDQLVVLSFRLFRAYGPQPTGHRFSIFFRTSTLATLAQQESPSTLPGSLDPIRVKWEDWGPENTRWDRNPYHNSVVCSMHGLRFITAAATVRPALSICDFNPYSVRKDTESPHVAPTDEPSEWRGVQSRLITESTIIDLPHVFNSPIESKMCYRETLIPVRTSHVQLNGALMMDEERILIFSNLL